MVGLRLRPVADVLVWCELSAFGGRKQTVCRADEVFIPGPHNLENALAAVAITGAMGVPVSVMADVLRTFRGVEHRIETVRELDGVTWINDSKGTNVDATVIALRAFGCPTILLAGGHEKGLSFEPLRAHLTNVKKVIGYGECGPRLIKELTDNEGLLVDDLEQALNAAVELSAPGDVILLSPTTSSYDQYSCFEERGEHFKKLVNALG